MPVSGLGPGSVFEFGCFSQLLSRCNTVEIQRCDPSIFRSWLLWMPEESSRQQAQTSSQRMGYHPRITVFAVLLENAANLSVHVVCHSRFENSIYNIAFLSK